jgi:hypothetical protein
VNPDSAYPRQKILEEFAAMLNESAPGYRAYEPRGYYVEDERPLKFFVYDLTDPKNTGTSLSACVNLLDNHVYHVAAYHLPFSLSHIVIFEGGSLKMFKAINCKNSKDSVADVINYLNTKLKRDKNRDEIIQRVKKYRYYGFYTLSHDPVLHCPQGGIDRSSTS